MALIVCYGTISAWKVREHSVARLAAWETRWPRSGSTDPRPSYWPATASMGSSDQGNVAGMDDSRVDLPVVRGPMPAATVNSELLDPTRGLREGSASLTRRYPMLSKMGSYTITAQTWLIDDKWQYQRMGMGSNWQRRIPVLYALAEAPASLVNAYVQSVMAIINAPFAAQLAPLDHDPDFIYYGTLFGWGARLISTEGCSLSCTTDRRQLSGPSRNLSIKSRAIIPNAHVFPVWPKSWRWLSDRRKLPLDYTSGHWPRSRPSYTREPASIGRSGPVQIPQLQSNIQMLQQFLQTIQAEGQ